MGGANDRIMVFKLRFAIIILNIQIHYILINREFILIE